METMDEWVDARLGELTLEEKVLLLSGRDAWRTPPVERVGVPSIKVSDGPNGARGNGEGKVTAACFPVGSALASTWNTALLGEVGAALAQEAKTKGAQILLGPTVNIHRSPLAGRNFECYSEDPHLTARLAVSFIDGLQAEGVGACIKHYVCNDSEFERNSISSEVGERALREIYLPPFEAAVAEAGPWSVMAAYNRINGVFACAHDRLNNEILKQEWGFDGAVISDWGAIQDTVDTANGGCDLEMPGPAAHYGQKLVAAVNNGEVDEVIVDDHARRMLRTIWRSGRIEHPADFEEEAIDRPEHRALTRRVAAEAVVVLKNDGAVLPLDAEQLKTIAVIGPNAEEGVIMGGGSSIVRMHYAVHPLEAVVERVGEGVTVTHEAGVDIERYCPQPKGSWFESLDDDGRGLQVEYFDSDDLSGPPVADRLVRGVSWVWWSGAPNTSDRRRFSARWIGRFVPDRTGAWTFGLGAVGRCRLLLDGDEVIDNWTAPARGDLFFGRGSNEELATVDLTEGRPVKLVIEYSRDPDGDPAAIRFGVRPPAPHDRLARAAELAAAADVAIVVVGTNADYETEGADRRDMRLPGDQDELIERVAAANARTIVVLNTGSPVEMPWIDRVPAIAQAWFGGQELGHALADVLFGDIDASGRLPTTFPVRLEDNPAFVTYPGENGEVLYGEGVFVGYRYYDAKKVAPLFPFGHGLSYTSFRYGDVAVAWTPTPEPASGEVSVDVTNTGDRSGSEVVQLYLRRSGTERLSRPDIELRGFAKVGVDPGQTVTVRLPLSARSFAYFDPAIPGWVAEAGTYDVLVGSSSRDLRAGTECTLTETIVQPI